MDDGQSIGRINSALLDFRRMRRRADLEALMARLTGKSVDLLSYEDVSRKLRVRGSIDRGLQDIPLNAIVGSVDRYDDFSRSFLPRRDDDAQRWAKVELATISLTGVPPIEVYQIGEVYFVSDGNHRVSVARQMEASHIEAHVIEVKTKVPITPDIQPDELISKARLAEFLELTSLDELRPNADLSVTSPGNYRLFLEQIDLQQQRLREDQARDIPYKEAVCTWYDQIYCPVVQLIRERGILHHFPRRTPTDLYAWTIRHKAELASELNWEIDPEAAAVDLVDHFSSEPHQLVSRFGGRLLDAITPDEIEGGPSPGEWRKEHTVAHHLNSLFVNVLVPVNNRNISWQALEQAIVVARREGGHIFGLHVAAEARQLEDAEVHKVKTEFQRRCDESAIVGEFAIEVGGVARKICDRSRWSDLVVLGLSHPPPDQALGRLSSGFGTLVRRCSRPILAVPGTVSQLDRALLAYDGSKKAREALFLATYLAGQWQIQLDVVTIAGSRSAAETVLTGAKQYIEDRGVQATCIAASGLAGAVILETAVQQQTDFIVMGGYGHNPVLEVVFGSSVDQILRSRLYPVLICR